MTVAAAQSVYETEDEAADAAWQSSAGVAVAVEATATAQATGHYDAALTAPR